MKGPRALQLVVLAILTVAATAALAAPAWAGSAFTYQGQLQFNGQPVNANCSFEFGLFDAASGGTQQGSTLSRSNVTVTNGLFTVELDFGTTALGSGNRWIETSVGCVGLSGLITLSRQPLTSAPYAFFADTVAASAVDTSQIAGDAVTSVKIADGTIEAADVNTSSLQRRVTGACAADTAMTYINEDGTIGCAPTGGLWLPYSESASEGSPLLSLSNTGSGIGVRGSSNTGRGVFGQSGSSTGVSGLSSTATGVEGVSTSGIGVWGRASGGSADPPTFFTFPVTPGVYGNGDSGPGVMGASVSGAGVLGTSVSNSGVAGLSTGGGDGVSGMSTAAGIGVRGSSSSGHGVYGETADTNIAYPDDPFGRPRAGVTGMSSAGNGVGVRGIANGSSAYAIVGTSSGYNGRAVYGEAWGDYGHAVRGTAKGDHSVGVVG